MSPKIFELVANKRGSISAEHGVGLLKRISFSLGVKKKLGLCKV